MTIEVPQVVRNKAVVNGFPEWPDQLPDLVADLRREWRFTLGRTYDGGTEAFVADVDLADGTPAALKVLVPGQTVATEIAVLEHAQGDSCVRLFASDASRGALLLERLGSSMFDLGIPFAERLPILADAASRLWRPAPHLDLPTGAAKGRWLIDAIERMYAEVGAGVCDERTIAHAIECAERRIAAHDDEHAVLVHGDVHRWNCLQTLDGTGWKLVDPDGMLAEPEYDLGILMREDPTEADGPEARATWLAERTGCDRTAIWEWGVVERVSTGLVATQIDLQPEAAQMLAVADEIALRAR